MIASRAHKIKLMPTPEQQEKLRRRFLQGQAVRHLCIEWSREMYAAWKQDPANNAYPSYEAMDKRYTKEKPEEGNLLPRCSAQRKLQRKVQDSNNYWKQYRRLKKAYKRKANVINDALHKYTTRLCKTHSTVVTENLSIADLIKTSEKWMRRGFALSQMKRLIQLLQYKAAIYRQVERFFASSKTCSRCGYKNNALTLADRTYVCPECGLQIDRDLNAAHNIRNFIVGSVRPDLR